MALICDYCGEPITDIALQIGGAGPLAPGQLTPTIVRLDVHVECAKDFKTGLDKVKGKRGTKNEPTPT